MTSLTTPIDELKSHPQRFIIPDTELLSAPDEEDEDDFDESTIFEKDSPVELSSPLQRQSDFSIVTPNKSRSRSYKYIQLEHALTSANLLTEKDDRIKFQHDYRDSLRENRFEEFLKIYYQKLHDHQTKLKHERTIKRTRTFTFVDLEKNFLSLDPTRDIKVVFLDDPTTPSKFIGDIHRNSAVSAVSDDDTIEEFYKSRSRHLLRNPSRARDEITLFARHATEHLQERLPHLSRVPHRVKIVDQRETKVVHDERTLLQMKHKHALSLISKRRQMVLKMMIQANKNQIKMKKLNFQSPLTMNNPSCCRELLDKINQIEHIIKEEQFKRPQTAFISQRTISKTTDYSSTQTTSTLTQSYSSSSTLFHDALSLDHMEKTNNVHVIQSKRPLTAPMEKMTWINYC